LLRGNLRFDGFESGVKPGGFVDQVKNGEYEESKSDEGETKYLSTSEGSEETFGEILDGALNPFSLNANILLLLGILRVGIEEIVEIIDVLLAEVRLGDGILEFITKAAVVSGSSISINGNLHTNVTSSNRGSGTNEERDSSVREVGCFFFLGDLSGINGETDNKSENAAEER
jgi:hypothetical protein